MHRIDTDDAVGNLFVDGNPQIGQAGTRVPADWLNDLQEGLCRLVEHTGTALVKGDHDQIWEAVLAIATGVAGAGVGVGSVPTTRAITTAGLITGGHALDADVALSVVKAAGADLVAGTEAGKVVTPDLLGTLFSIANPASLPGEISITFPGGWQVRIGQHLTAMAEGAYAMDFAAPFTHAGLFFFAMPINSSASNYRDCWLQRVSISRSGLVVMDQWTGNEGTSSSLDGFDYIAFGC